MKINPRKFLAVLIFWTTAIPWTAAASAQDIDQRVAQVQAKVVEWRRDLHQHPELSNREIRTAKIVADHLRSLGIEVRTGVAHTGVVGILRGGKPGPVVALRADMDALPVTEEVDLPFASKVRTNFGGREVGVMHACGHDTHVSMLMGAAEVLAGMQQDLPGTVKFLFQPAEEGAPPGEEGGAGLMISNGALEDPKVDAVFGLHVLPFPVGQIQYRPGGIMASSDSFRIEVEGSQSHGALPWLGVDPIVVSAQIVLGLQSIVSRQIDLTASPAVITVGSIQAGVRSNIIPDRAVMEGTIRTFERKIQQEIHARIRRTAEMIAQSAGAKAKVEIMLGNPVTYNDPDLTKRMVPTLERAAGRSNVTIAQATTTAEDFSLYEQKVPGMFFFLGVTPMGTDPAKAAPNHSPRFFADESALPLGVKVLVNLAVDFLAIR